MTVRRVDPSVSLLRLFDLTGVQGGDKASHRIVGVVLTRAV